MVPLGVSGTTSSCLTLRDHHPVISAHLPFCPWTIDSQENACNGIY